MWQGDTASGNAQLARFDGLIKLIAPSGVLTSGVVDGNPTNILVATGITAGNVIGIVDGMYQLIPTSILDNGDVFIACGMDTFRKYTVALKNLNLFNYAAEASDFEIIIAGEQNIMVIRWGFFHKQPTEVWAHSRDDFHAVPVRVLLAVVTTIEDRFLAGIDGAFSGLAGFQVDNQRLRE